MIDLPCPQLSKRYFKVKVLTSNLQILIFHRFQLEQAKQRTALWSARVDFNFEREKFFLFRNDETNRDFGACLNRVCFWYFFHEISLKRDSFE